MRKSTVHKLSEFKIQSTDFYKFLIERSPELICFHDPNGIFLYVSPSVTSMLGYQPEELIGKNPYDYFNPLDRERIFTNSHKPILEGRERERVEYQFLRKDGKYVWLQTITQPIFDDQGNVIALLATTREYLEQNTILDTTNSKQVLDEIRLSEEKFFNAFYYSGIGMALVSLEGKWLEVNSSLLDIIGYSRDEILKLTFQDITHPDDLTADLNLLQETLENKRDSYRMEKRYFHKNGSIIWVY